jgi:hypothetical protein
MVLILIFVVAMVAWALHLMQEAVDSKDFSLMLAGFLVSSAAAATVGVYFLMGDCMGHLSQISARSQIQRQASIPLTWIVEAEEPIEIVSDFEPSPPISHPL